jgi:hypothetical protein
VLKNHLTRFLGFVTLIITIIAMLSPFTTLQTEEDSERETLDFWSFGYTKEFILKFPGQSLKVKEAHYLIEIWGGGLPGLICLSLFIIQLISIVGLIMFIRKLTKDFLVVNMVANVLVIIIMSGFISYITTISEYLKLSLGNGYLLTILATVVSLITYLTTYKFSTITK